MAILQYLFEHVNAPSAVFGIGIIFAHINACGANPCCIRDVNNK